MIQRVEIILIHRTLFFNRTCHEHVDGYRSSSTSLITTSRSIAASQTTFSSPFISLPAISNLRFSSFSSPCFPSSFSFSSFSYYPSQSSSTSFPSSSSPSVSTSTSTSSLTSNYASSGLIATGGISCSSTPGPACNITVKFTRSIAWPSSLSSSLRSRNSFLARR